MSTIATQARPLEGNSAARSKHGRNKRRTGATNSASRATSKTSNIGPNSKNTDKLVSNGGSNATVSGQKPVAEAEPKSPTEGGSMDICWICAEPVKYYALSECNHRTCHVCALRLRALYKKMECTFCKEMQDQLIFTKSSGSQFETFKLEAIARKDPKLSIYFESQEIMEESLLLLRFNCPEEYCDYIGNGWSDLRLHARATHEKLMCDLCIQNKKIFSHEHILYPPRMLPVHVPSMSYRPSKTALREPVNGGIHPLCEFCRECFFGDDELHAHLRERHEECFICKRSGVNQHFLNYDALEKHFNNAHFPCTQPDCLARKFVVFDTMIDLKVHIVDEHGAEMSSKDRKDARRVQADFAFHSTVRLGRRDDDRERDRDREPPPHQQQAPASRSTTPAGRPPPTNARRRDAFGASLTDPSARTTPSVNIDQDLRSTSPHTPEADPVVSERHAAFMTRLESLAFNPPVGVPAVQAATRSYRAAESSARDLILTIWNVLDQNLDHTASIINAFVDLVDEEEKKQDILSSWKAFVVEQRRQFPELVPTSIGSNYAGITSGRVLKVKNSTAARSSQSLWNRVALVAGSSSSGNTLPRAQERFPPLGSSSSSNSVAKARTPGQRSTPWAGSSTASPSVRPPPTSNTPSTVTTTSQPSMPSMPKPRLSRAHFPELPAPTAVRAKPQVSGNVTLKNILGQHGGPVVNAWGGNGPPSSSAPPTAEAESTESGEPADESLTNKGKRAKGKQKQKQMLFTMGALPT